MSPRRLRFTILGVLLLALGVAVVARIAANPTPVKTDVAGLLANASASRARPFEVLGHVAAGTRQRPGPIDWQFTLQDGASSVRVQYRGQMPSTFQDGARMRVVGTMQGQTFVASNVSVRVPM